MTFPVPAEAPLSAPVVEAADRASRAKTLAELSEGLGSMLQLAVNLTLLPRAALALVHAARARAFVHDRDYAVPADLFALAEDVVLHRIRLTYEALADGRRPRAVLEDILASVVPHFEQWPLMSGKRRDFERFALICRSMAVGEHRTRRGLIRIVELASEMNPSGTRRYDAAAILGTLQGEEIVCASGNGGGTRSSDLHEWRNDLGAVSTRDPVKL